MKVLVINDQDGHCHAFDISSFEKRKRIYFAMAMGFTKRGTGNWSSEQVEARYGNDIRTAIASGDVGAILEIFEKIDLHFDRSGGGKMYEVDVEQDFNIRLCSNIG